MDGILLVDKPAGPTSHDVVSKVRRALNEDKAGHSGTLDPQATGLLVLALGAATRWLPYLPGDKRYAATLKLGLRTDTQDVWGKPLATAPVTVEEAAVRKALESLVGNRMQVPPMTSAVKKDGRKLYELARQGLEVERTARPIEVLSLKVTGWRPEASEADFEVHCSGGTYIRTLCDEVGEALGTHGCLAALRRTAAGPFRIEEALTLDQIPARGIDGLLDAGKALAHLPERLVIHAEEAPLSHGRDLDLKGEPQGETYRLTAESGRLLALAKPVKSGEGWTLHPEKVFANPTSLSVAT